MQQAPPSVQQAAPDEAAQDEAASPEAMFPEAEAALDAAALNVKLSAGTGDDGMPRQMSARSSAASSSERARQAGLSQSGFHRSFEGLNGTLKDMSHDGQDKAEKQLQKATDDIRKAIVAESNRYVAWGERRMPWCSASGEVVWPQWRVRLAKLLMMQRFETVMGVLIVMNVVCIVLDTNLKAQCYPRFAADVELCPTYMDANLYLANLIFLVIFTLECGCGIFIFRLMYFQNKWNVLDFVVVILSLFSEAVGSMANLTFLRVFRMARLMRAFRLVIAVKELYMILVGLTSALKVMFFGAILLMMGLVVWGIIMVEFVHPVNSAIVYTSCERCGSAYGSVERATLTLFTQIVAGDGWGTPSVRLIEDRPTLAFFLISAVVTMSLGVLNLITAVVVESASEARERDQAEKAKESLMLKQKHLLGQKLKLLTICASMDENYNGMISLNELCNAWETSDEFRHTMVSLEVQEEDLTKVFQLLSRDGLEVSYRVFVDKLYYLSTCDMRLAIPTLKLEVDGIRDKVDDILLKDKRHVDMMEAMQETLARHTVLLEALSKATGGGAGGADSGAAETPKEAAVAEVSAPPATASSCLLEVSDLHQYLQELAGTKLEILRKVEAQEAMLMSHAKVLMSVHSALENPSGFDDALTGVGKAVVDLKRHVRETLAPAMRELDRRADEEVSAMEDGDRLLDAVASELKIPKVLRPTRPAQPGRVSRLMPAAQTPPRSLAQAGRDGPACGVPVTAAAELFPTPYAMPWALAQAPASGPRGAPAEASPASGASSGIGLAGGGPRWH